MNKKRHFSILKVSIYTYLTIAIITIFACFKYHEEIFKQEGFIPYYLSGNIYWIWQIFLGLGVAFFIIILCILGRFFTKWMYNVEIELKKHIGNLYFHDILIIGFLSGTAEEFLFRGLLQPTLGILWTSIIFAILHFPSKKILIFYPIFAMIMSIILGYITIINHGSIISAIVAHVTINIVNLYRINEIESPIGIKMHSNSK